MKYRTQGSQRLDTRAKLESMEEETREALQAAQAALLRVAETAGQDAAGRSLARDFEVRAHQLERYFYPDADSGPVQEARRLAAAYAILHLADVVEAAFAPKEPFRDEIGADVTSKLPEPEACKDLLANELSSSTGGDRGMIFDEFDARVEARRKGTVTFDREAVDQCVDRDRETRRDPSNGNSMVLAHIVDSNNEWVFVTDIFGGHGYNVRKEEWESWERVKVT